MKFMFRHALAAILATSFAETGFAGPHEDASTAYLRGDYATALRLWRPLANQGLTGAQYGLGLLYDKGRGVRQDFVRAHMWFDLSAAQGNRSAVLGRDTAARRMTAAQIAEALKLAREWHEEKSDE